MIGVWTVLSASGVTGNSIGRSTLGLVGILFAPGYAFVAALFPGKRFTAGPFDRIESKTTWKHGRVTGLERVLLAVGMSVCMVPLIELGLFFTPWGVSTPVRLGAIGVSTVLLAVIATVRRLRLPPEERFEVQGREFVLGVVDGIRTRQNGSVLSVLIVAGLLISISGIGVAVLQTTPGEQFTEFYITTESPDTGERIAGGYPDEIPQGETRSVTVGITNNEHEETDYTVVVLLQEVGESGEVQEMQIMDRFSLTVPTGETVSRSHTIEPELTGENLKVTYLLYTGPVPENSGLAPETAYRNLHFWIDVPAEGTA